MSLDSVTRIDSFFESQVATPNSIYTIYEDKNEGLFEGGGGPFVKIWTEASFDDPTAVEASPEDFSCYTEEGIIIIQIFAVKGLGTMDLYSLSRIVTLVRDAFRGKRILPTGSEEGIIYFESISPRQTIEVAPKDFPIGNSNSLGLTWKRKDIFINYQKNYE